MHYLLFLEATVVPDGVGVHFVVTAPYSRLDGDRACKRVNRALGGGSVMLLLLLLLHYYYSYYFRTGCVVGRARLAANRQLETAAHSNSTRG